MAGRGRPFKAVARGAYRFTFPGANNLELFEDLLDRSFPNFAEGNDEAVAVLARAAGGAAPARQDRKSVV